MINWKTIYHNNLQYKFFFEMDSDCN